MSKTVVAVRLVARVQHVALLTSLHALSVDCLQKEDVVVLIGELWENEIVNELRRAIGGNVSLFYERRSPQGVGKDTVRLFTQLSQYVNGTDQVLFLDDDTVITPKQYLRLKLLKEQGMGVIGWQTGCDFKEIGGVASFTLFCSLVDGWIVHEILANTQLTDFLDSLNRGAEFIVLDWFMRRKLGVSFNTLVVPEVLHLDVVDKYKLWYGYNFKELYFEILGCSNLAQVQNKLEARGLF